MLDELTIDVAQTWMNSVMIGCIIGCVIGNIIGAYIAKRFFK